MKTEFLKFPSTPHLAVLGGFAVRDDKVFTESEREEFLQHEIVVEEKIDGANLGISFGKTGNILLQNRGNYIQLPYVGQWKKLNGWLSLHTDLLFDILGKRYLIFGEWCYARHSVYYNKLPDWFLGFDIYDREMGIFLSVPERNRILSLSDIAKVPEIKKGRFTLSELTELLSDSKIGDTPAEGIYLRLDNHSRIERRAKLLRPEFIQSIKRHWSKSGIEKNKLLWRRR